ncbi:MAG TPA: DNA polymerase III subunit delta' C-terminal domain-containing protein [Anaerolineaceae bacterium]|nr:DNA polymerase III subunit delta' C-terminal domain-containing protein [Anaerolineaceae bacterium]
MSWDLLGHTWAENLLRKHIANNEARHAYLFTGAPGVGRRSLALAFASALNCTQPPLPGDYCGTCRVCRHTERMQLPDLSIVAPENEGGIIKVSQVRELQHTLSLTPYESRYRVALLLNFQLANASAQNALLKTLEEAPEKVVLLLTADAADSLLPTIASRCEILRLRPMAIDALEEALISRWNLPAQKARLYAHLASGRPGMALQMARDPNLLEKRAAWVEELLHLLPANRRERFSASETLARSRDQLRLMLQVWLSFARDLLLATSGSGEKIVNLDHQAEIERIASGLPARRSLQMVNSLIASLEKLEANANLRLLLDNTLLDIPQIN